MSNDSTTGDNTSPSEYTNWPTGGIKFVPNPQAYNGEWKVTGISDNTIIPSWTPDLDALKKDYDSLLEDRKRLIAKNEYLTKENVNLKQTDLELRGHKKALKDVVQENTNLKKAQEVPATMGQVESFKTETKGLRSDLDDAIYKRDQAYRDVDVQDANVARLTEERDYLRKLLDQMTTLAPTLHPPYEGPTYQRSVMKKPC